MYQPISYKVIRQALSWSCLPDPISCRMVSQFKWPNGTVSGEYILAFDGYAIRNTFSMDALSEGSAADIHAQHAIQDSFCVDVTLVRTWVDVQHDKYYVELYGRVTPDQPELFPITEEA